MVTPLFSKTTIYAFILPPRYLFLEGLLVFLKFAIGAARMPASIKSDVGFATSTPLIIAISAAIMRTGRYLTKNHTVRRHSARRIDNSKATAAPLLRFRASLLMPDRHITKNRLLFSANQGILACDISPTAVSPSSIYCEIRILV